MRKRPTKVTRGQTQKQFPQTSNSTRTDILLLEVVHKVIFIHRSFIDLKHCLYNGNIKVQFPRSTRKEADLI